jgi:NTP pyrophosphatase (non-canonical NTP hydrolase)
MNNDTHRDNALNDILAERKRQNLKWGEQNHDDATWALIVGEEFGEVQQAILHDRFGGKAAGTTRAELVQLAAVCLQWLECIDRREPQKDSS